MFYLTGFRNEDKYAQMLFINEILKTTIFYQIFNFYFEKTIQKQRKLVRVINRIIYIITVAILNFCGIKYWIWINDGYYKS